MKSIFLALGVLVAFAGCGKKEEQKSKEKGQTVISKSTDIHGTWVLESVSDKTSADVAAISGTKRVIYRANGTMFYADEAFSSTLSGTTISKNCTTYGNSKWKIDNGSIVLTDTVYGGTEGNCGATTTLPDVFAVASKASRAYRNSDKLILEEDYTYAGVGGVSTKGTVVSKFKKTAEETWDGTGIDPRFNGSFTDLKLFTASVCTLPADQGPVITSGIAKVTIDATGKTYQGSQTAFKVSTNAACTATDSGTIIPHDLYLETNQATSSNDCIKTEADPTGYVKEIERDIVIGDKYVNFFVDHTPDTDCTNGTLLGVVISVMTKE